MPAGILRRTFAGHACKQRALRLVRVLQHNASYVAAQAAFVTQQLTTAPATYNFVVSHYPLFGTSRQYGAPAGQLPSWHGHANVFGRQAFTPCVCAGLYSSNGLAFPGEFNGWQLVRRPPMPYTPELPTANLGCMHALLCRCLAH